MVGKPRVFISYARNDTEIARKVAHTLSENDILVYSDELFINLGDSFISTIRNQIAASDCIVFIMSQNTLSSEWAQENLKYAIQKDMRQRSISLIPFMIGQLKLPEFISSLQVVDASKNFERGLKKLVELLRNASVVNLEKLSDSEFEDFSYDFLKAYGYRSIKRARSGPDLGYDFTATYEEKDPFGRTQTVDWMIQIKAQKSMTDTSILRSFLGELSFRGEGNRGLFMTSSQLTTPALEWLEHMRKSGKPHILILDGPEITKLTLSRPKLVDKYFKKVGEE